MSTMLIAIITSSAIVASCQGKLEMKVVEQWEDGTTKTAQYYRYHDEVRIQVSERHYYPDGQIRMEGGLMGGKRHGKWKSYFENGEMWSRGVYENGLKEGPWIVYYPDGNEHYKGTYHKGEKVGRWQFWSRDGSAVLEETY